MVEQEGTQAPPIHVALGVQTSLVLHVTGSQCSSPRRAIMATVSLVHVHQRPSANATCGAPTPTKAKTSRAPRSFIDWIMVGSYLLAASLFAKTTPEDAP